MLICSEEKLEMFDEHEFIICIYSIILEHYNDLFPEGIRNRGFAPTLTDAEALTIEIVGEYLELPNDSAIYGYFGKHYSEWFPNLPSRSTLVRQWNNLWIAKQMIWAAIVGKSGQSRAPFQITDTLPIPVCSLRRAPGSAIFGGDILCQPDYGCCASKGTKYYGFKGGIRISSAGMIVHAQILDARPHDSNFIDDLLHNVPSGTTVIGDKGFISKDRQTEILDGHHVILKTPLRQNMKNRPGFVTDKSENRLRQLIETVNGQLTERFHIQNMKVRKGWTLLAKWYRKILAHTICVFINLIHGRKATELATIVS